MSSSVMDSYLKTSSSASTHTTTPYELIGINGNLSNQTNTLSESLSTTSSNESSTSSTTSSNNQHLILLSQLNEENQRKLEYLRGYLIQNNKTETQNHYYETLSKRIEKGGEYLNQDQQQQQQNIYNEYFQMDNISQPPLLQQHFDSMVLLPSTTTSASNQPTAVVFLTHQQQQQLSRHGIYGDVSPSTTSNSSQQPLISFLGTMPATNS
jgi:hypothetical protein